VADDQVLAELARRYRHFARVEAHGRSPLYGRLGVEVAADPAIAGLLADLPGQEAANLLFAAIRWLWAASRLLPGPAGGRAERRAELTELMLARRTQTNEPRGGARPLLPEFAALPQPLALLEVGASAGLPCCRPLQLRIRRRTLTGPDPAAPVLRCEREARCPCRSGCPRSPGGRYRPQPAGRHRPRRRRLAALPHLPGEPDRRIGWPGRRGGAPAPTRLTRGDLVDDLRAVAAEAPAEATLVVFHSAVLVYVRSPAAGTSPPPSRSWTRSGCPTKSPACCPSWSASHPRRRARTRSCRPATGAPSSRSTTGHGRWVEWLAGAS